MHTDGFDFLCVCVCVCVCVWCVCMCVHMWRPYSKTQYNKKGQPNGSTQEGNLEYKSNKIRPKHLGCDKLPILPHNWEMGFSWQIHILYNVRAHQGQRPQHLRKRSHASSGRIHVKALYVKYSMYSASGRMENVLLSPKEILVHFS